jgi:hypothetical protein
MNRLLIIISLLTLVVIWYITRESNSAIYDYNRYPELRILSAKLKANLSKIQKESVSVLLEKPILNQKREEGTWIGEDAEKYVVTLKNQDAWILGWTQDDDWLNYPIMHDGEFFNYALKSLPTLCYYLNTVKNQVHIAGLSVLKPYGKIRPHIDSDQTYDKGLLNYHFNILCPEDTHKSILTINGKEIVQKTGNAILFDAGYKHSVDNKSDEYRIILFLDFKHAKSKVE